jgi:hypothetical protein
MDPLALDRLGSSMALLDPRTGERGCARHVTQDAAQLGGVARNRFDEHTDEIERDRADGGMHRRGPSQRDGARIPTRIQGKPERPRGRAPAGLFQEREDKVVRDRITLEHGSSLVQNSARVVAGDCSRHASTMT